METFKTAKTNVADPPSTVRFEVKEHMDQHIRDNLKVSTDGTAF
jgi:hypothetical protein